MTEEAVKSGASLAKACKIMNISPRTLQRYNLESEVKADGRIAAGANKNNPNKLTDEEEKEVLNIVNQPEFADAAPSQIVPALADRGQYICSESTMYRILRKNKQLKRRGKARAPSKYKSEPMQVLSPNQLWSWDITYLKSTVKGLYFYLYMILDVYSRKIVGWEVYQEESADYAAKTVSLAYANEKILGKSIILHADNGGPMKGATMLGMLEKLGVAASFSRPSISNDNPFSEAIFKTLKYSSSFPEDPFDTVESSRKWTDNFVNWYNEEHKHSAIKFVTPGQRHRCEDIAILAERSKVYEEAKAKRLGRWSKGCRNWSHTSVVTFKSLRIFKKKEVATPKAA